MKLADGREVETRHIIEHGHYNLYDCPGGIDGPHSLLSLDVDAGVTPFMTTCPDDGRYAQSRMYRVPVPEQHLPVRVIWRKPTKGELKRELRENGPGGHYASGGLAREWTGEQPSPRLVTGRFA